ncbi:hypothetical protein F4556_007219 [Kitasatospora gansuensis]|uniref:Uncharacterized protein n=1 Tax=Kitasatospora gansuensis TaxID=258050 RepID=A0A7W7SJL2_9ACTN|nr:hypothetical protein [Kitasatospora gansuensis]
MVQGTQDTSPQPPTTVQVISRVLDAPRRTASYF